MIDTSKFKTPAFAHQLEGIEFLLQREFGALFDEPGSGKSYQTINTACLFYEANLIDTVIVACPAGVKPVWSSLDFGEVNKHCFVQATMDRFDGTRTTLSKPKGRLYWVIVSYEFLREPGNLNKLIYQIREWNLKVMLVCDESIRLKSWKAQQTQAVLKLRGYCERAYILNGTPIGNSPLDLYSQMEILSPKILAAKNYWVFRNRHAIKGGWKGKQIVGYIGLDRLQNQIKPHAIRRLKKDCLDLPEKLYQVIEVPLEESTWKTYKQMRDQLIVWLSDTDASVARQAIVKIIRLSQITSGFIGGAEDGVEREVGSEKLKWLESWVSDRVEEDPNLALIIWCHHTWELNYLHKRFEASWKDAKCIKIQGGQSKATREDAIMSFTGNSSDDQKGPLFLFGQAQAGGLGLTLTRSHTVVFMSNDYNYVTRTQAEDRVHRHGQDKNVLYIDVLATGPKGQKTNDHTRYKSLQKKEDIAMWTSDKWRTILREEEEAF